MFVCCTGDNSESAAFVNPADGSVEEVPGFAFPTNDAPFSGIIGIESSETKIIVWYRLRKGSGLYDYDHFLTCSRLGLKSLLISNDFTNNDGLFHDTGFNVSKRRSSRPSW